MTENTARPKRVGLVIWLIVSQLTALGSLFFWFVAAGLGLIIAEMDKSAPAPAGLVWLWLYPILPLGMAIASWVAFAKRKNSLAGILSGLAVAPTLIALFLLWMQTL
jgi:hypothetical protein